MILGGFTAPDFLGENMVLTLNKPDGAVRFSLPKFIPAIVRRMAAELEEKIAAEELKGTEAFDELVSFFVFVYNNQFTYDEFCDYADVIDYDMLFNKVVIELNERSVQAITTEADRKTKNAKAPEA